LKEISREEEQVKEALRAGLQVVDSLEPWFIEGLQRWIRVFLPGRITVRVYPFENLPSFQVFGNLKRESFVDADLGNLLFAYGTRPNLKLTMVGLLTSVPPKEEASFDPLAEFSEPRSSVQGQAGPSDDVPDVEAEDPSAEDDSTAYEAAFRGVFAGMEGMESLARFSRFPNVTVYPIALYRRVPVSATET
jgi:hypothetical protein